MDKNSSHKIIKDTLESPFSKERFLLFTKNLLNHLDEEKAFHAHGYVPEVFKNYVKTYERLGTYTDPESKKIDVLIVYLQKESSLERARTAQRNFVARYLKDRDQKDGGLVAFVSPNSEDWRFSLIKMEYKFTEGKNGKVKVKEEFTPARRWSFLVGANESSHTAKSRLAPVVQEDEHNPLLKILEEAFNIEQVTREFFEKYRDLFLRVKETLDEIIKKDASIKKEFMAKGVDTVDFSKKLLGQIVFLYFLQKKGWFGVARDAGWGSGPKNFLRQLFEKKHSDYKNFFNDILEPLFYEALAVERSKDFYSRFNCKIPFLNGGLFDPINNYDWVHTDILLPNDIFSNDRPTKEGDTGDGILDIFDRYNFTVKEDEPLEKEVAVDPEMLGKVFENLLEVKDRKSKGTYYTPREIVHYMCVQSLVNHLAIELEGKVSKDDLEQLIKYGDAVGENEARVEEKGEETQTYYYKMPESIRVHAKLIDEKLADIKVCDPAIGSGAFPVGMMTEIVRARNVLSSYIKSSDRTLYNFKRDCIQNSLYGVDIDPSAVEIAKLRLWLSLVVDEDDIKQIKPLPNLDYKIMQGNSLLEEFEGVKLFDEKLLAGPDLGKEQQIEKTKSELNRLQKEYIDLHSQGKLTNSKKQEFDLEFKKFNGYLSRLTKPQKSNEGDGGLFDTPSKAKEKAKELKTLHKEFFEASQKSRKEQIKKRIEALEWELIEETLREQGERESLKKIELYKRANTKPFFLWKLYFAEVFEEKGGFDVVIANPPYIDSESMVNELNDVREAIQRTYQMTKGNWDIYIAFFELGFKRLNANGTLTFITPDKWISKPFGDELRKKTIDNIFAILKAGRKIFETAKVDSIISFFCNKTCDTIKILEFEDGQFLFKREEDKKSLASPFALDHLFSDKLDLLRKIEKSVNRIKDFSECENACATSDAYKLQSFIKESLESKFSETKQLKIINTGTIGKYCSKWGKREMTYLKHKYLCPIVDKEKFLAAFKNSYGEKSLQKKIVIKGLNLLDACLDENGSTIPGKTTLIIADQDVQKLKLLLAILNSKLPIFYIKERYPASSYNQGTTFTTDMINNFPVPKITEPIQKQLIDIVGLILCTATTKDFWENGKKQAEIEELQEKIDRLIYKLYELTPEEVAMVKKEN